MRRPSFQKDKSPLCIFWLPVLGGAPTNEACSYFLLPLPSCLMPPACHPLEQQLPATSVTAEGSAPVRTPSSRVPHSCYADCSCS